MEDDYHSNLERLVQSVAPSQEEGAGLTETLLHKHITEFAEHVAALPRGTVEQINIALDEEGDVTVITSIKIPNIKFHLGEFMLEAASTALSVSVAPDMRVKLVVSALKFMVKARQLAKVSISTEDARVLIAIHKLTTEHEIPTIDKLIEVLDNALPAEVGKSIHNLEALACISVTMNEILLNESIVYRRAS